MWVSQNMKSGTSEQNKVVTQTGNVSIGGFELSAVTQGEKRNLKVALAGGYKWTPEVGENVLILTTEEGEAIVVGVIPEEQEELSSEQLVLEKGSNKIRISQNGDVEINARHVEIRGSFVSIDGSLSINGEKYIPYTGGGGIL